MYDVIQGTHLNKEKSRHHSIIIVKTGNCNHHHQPGSQWIPPHVSPKSRPRKLRGKFSSLLLAAVTSDMDAVGSFASS